MKNFRTLVTLSACIFFASSYGMGSKTPAPPPGQPPPSTSKYAHLDPQHYINRVALNAATAYFDAHLASIKNQRYLSVIDFSKYSGQKRFYVINMSSGAVELFHTAHGLGSDPNYSGYAESFSNVPESKKTSLGPYVTGTTYDGSHGYSLYLDGMSASNSNARARAIVVHGASYVDASLQKMGRSWGCPALSLEDYVHVINLIKNGSLLFAWSD